MSALTQKTGPRLRQWVGAVEDRPGYFLAWGAEQAGVANAVAVPTLSTIRWAEDHLFFTGPVVEVRG